MPASDPFHALVADARAFLSDLAQNNTRDWFAAHKHDYDGRLKTPATLLMEQVAAKMARDGGPALRPKLFRPHRDVRFSRDKTPYHTHLHMLWSAGKPGPNQPGFFFGVSPEYVTLGGGLMGFDKPALDAWRKSVDGPDGETLAAMIATLGQRGYSPREPELKRVPAPYPADHPHAELLRRKSLTVWREIPENDWNEPLKFLPFAFAELAPLTDLLRAMTHSTFGKT